MRNLINKRLSSVIFLKHKDNYLVTGWSSLECSLGS